MKKILLASNNIGKIKEFNALLSSIGAEVIPQKQLMIEECSEPFDTFIENAIAKARNAAEHSDLPVLADDSGICIEALDGKPGINSKKFLVTNGGHKKSFKIIKEKVIEKNNTKAFFQTSISLTINSRKNLYFDGVVNGNISCATFGTSGFGYDPIFVPSGYNKTYAQMNISEKNKISHRAIALCGLKNKLKELFN